MPRIRSVHPAICTSETMARLSFEAQVCFIRLWTHCDDEGRCEDRPVVLAATLFAANEEITSEELEVWLSELESAGCIQRYQVAGKNYLSVGSWHQWQKPQKPRKSEIPAPPDPDSYTAPVLVVEGYASGEGEGVGVGEGKTIVEQSSTSLTLLDEHSISDDPVTIIFNEWKEATGHTKAKLSDDRRRLIRRALANYSLDELVDAVKGVTLSKFHMGDNENQTRYDDIQVILRNAKQIERFRDLYRHGPVRVKPQAAGAIERLARGEL